MTMNDSGQTVFTLLLISLLLVACGGGGGGSDGDVHAGFVVAGSITPDALNRVDSDTNDPETPRVPNNHRGQAQVIVAPAIVGGFVAAPGTFSRFGPAGDVADFFEVHLQAGQQIVLDFPDGIGLDLHLYLYNQDGLAVDASLFASDSPVTPSARRSLSAPEAGRYYIEVRALSGRGNYTLRMDSERSLALEVHRGPRVSDAFVAGDLVVQTRMAAALSQAAVLQVSGLRTVAGYPDREQLWRVTEGQTAPLLEALTAWQPDSREWPRWVSAELRDRYHTLQVIKALRGLPEIAAVSPNFVIYPQRLPNDPLQGLQWFHEPIGLPAAWEISTGRAPDAEVIVAVVDTGVFLGHEDLSGQLLPGYDFVRGRTGGADPGDPSRPGQSTWHGTHVAGTVAAATDNRKGVAGVSWGAKILPVRTLSDSGGTLYDTLQGVRYAAGMSNDSGAVPARPADIINLSLGGGSFVQAHADLFQEIRDRGIFVIAASGNNAGEVAFPAAYPAVFAVGATDAVSQRAPYSSFGSALDFVAPGGDMRVDRTGDGYGDGILSTLVDDSSGTPRSEYAFYQGTSMATAVASGVAALARSVKPDLAPDLFAQWMESGRVTDDIAPTGWDSATGWGQINAFKVLGAARGDAEVETPPQLSAVPARLEFGLTETVLQLSLRNAGGGTLTVTGLGSDGPWLFVDPVNVDSAGLGSYRVRVARDGLADGRYEEMIRVTAEPGEQALNVPVLLRVAAPDLAVDTVGRIYVLLLNEAGESVAEQGVDLVDGRYSYRFEDVPEGEYRIAAGTDMNDDRQICDPGEACGAYPTLALFERVRVDRDLTGLDFSVGFRGLAEPSVAPLGLSRTNSQWPDALQRTFP